MGSGGAALGDGEGDRGAPATPARKVAFTLSDSFVVDRHRDGSQRSCSTSGRIDILFANEAEIEALAGSRAISRARSRRSQAKVETLVVTRGEEGALAHRAATSGPTFRPSRSRELVDTTGAGDLFAAGFLAGEARGAWASSSRCGSARSAPPK